MRTLIVLLTVQVIPGLIIHSLLYPACTCTSPTVTPAEPVAVSESLTTEQLFSFLHPHASKWQSLGKALSLDEDRLEDEVFPNNETDEACLLEMLELYMMRSDLDHSWEEIKAALEMIESSSESCLYYVLRMHTP